MMPIVRTGQKMVNPWNGKEFIGNVVLDRNGRECVWVDIHYCLLNKNGKVGKRITKDWI